MSCLPQLFSASKSQHLPLPSKVGGVFSIHLRSAHFNNLKQPSALPQAKGDKSSSSYSLQGKRYRSWTNRQQSFRNSKSSNKTFYKQKVSFEEGLEQTGHGYSNLNNKSTNQSEMEAISNFNIVKRNIFQSIHLSHKILQLSDTQLKTVKDQLAELGKALGSDMDSFKERFMKECAAMTKCFREERRGVMGEGKAISQQLVYLTEQIATAKSISSELQTRFGRVTHQFI